MCSVCFQSVDLGVFCMTKAAMDMFTKCLALGEYLHILNGRLSRLIIIIRWVLSNLT